MEQPQEINQKFLNEAVASLKSLRDIATMLIKERGIHEGKYQLFFEMQSFVGSFGISQEQVFPGATFSVSRIGLIRSEVANNLTVDASIVNPAKKPKKAKAAQSASEAATPKRRSEKK